MSSCEGIKHKLLQTTAQRSMLTSLPSVLPSWKPRAGPQRFSVSQRTLEERRGNIHFIYKRHRERLDKADSTVPAKYYETLSFFGVSEKFASLKSVVSVVAAAYAHHLQI